MEAEISNKLNALIGIGVDLIMKDGKGPSLSAMATRLKDLGLSNPDIGVILGKTPVQVAKLHYEATGRKNAKGK